MGQNVYKKNQLVLKELNLPSDVSLTLNKDVSKVGATNVNKVMKDLKGKNIGNGQLVVPVSGSTVDPQTNNGVSVVTGTDDLSNMRKAAENVKKIGGNKLVVQDGDVNNGVLSKSKTGSTSNAMGESVIFKKNDILEMIGGKKTRNRKLKEGIYDPYDDNEVFDIGKTNDYRVNWMFSDLSRWGSPKIVSQGQEEFSSMEECVEFIKKTAEESEKKSGHDLYATECKIEQKIGSLADDRWDNVCSYDGMYLHQIINSIQETNESVVFRKNEILEMIGGKKRSKKKSLRESEEGVKFDRYGNPIKRGGQGWGVDPTMANRQGYDKNGNPSQWFSRSVAVATAVLIKDGGEWYVLANERGAGTPDYQGYWNLPCGYLDYNETAEEAAAREVYEETGIKCQNIKYALHSTSPNENRQNVCFFFVSFLNGSIDDYQFSKENMEEGEVGGIKWVPISEADNVQWAFDHDVLIQKIVSKFGGQMYGDNTKYKSNGEMIDKAIEMLENDVDTDYIISFLKDLKRKMK